MSRIYEALKRAEQDAKMTSRVSQPYASQSLHPTLDVSGVGHSLQAPGNHKDVWPVDWFRSTATLDSEIRENPSLR